MSGIWISDAELAKLPTDGNPFVAVKSAATGAWPTANIANQDSQHDVCVYAGALYAKRTGDPNVLAKTVKGLRDVIGTEVGARALAVGRNLLCYVLAADILDFAETNFVNWMHKMMTTQFEGMTVAQCHEKRANNWGAHAGSSRLAACLYLKDTAQFTKACGVWQGWLGNYPVYHSFAYGDKSWQADKMHPLGINPKGSKILVSGAQRNVDGCVPDDQRRAAFTWPPPEENYVRGTIGAALCATNIMRRGGLTGVETFSDSALKRAIVWFQTEAKGHFSGDDAWIPPLARYLYPGVTSEPGDPKTRGKHMAWTAWTNG